MTEKLTVIIPCKDEEANIRGCIHSARKVADEIVVADSGSTDRTLGIVRETGAARVIGREYVNYGDFTPRLHRIGASSGGGMARSGCGRRATTSLTSRGGGQS